MIEDKLTRNERIRLESLNQAVQSSIGSYLTPEYIVGRAKVYEEYIRNGEKIIKEKTNAPA